MANLSLAEINAQIKQHEEQVAQLRAAAADQRKEEIASVVADIRQKIAEFSITATELKLGKARKRRKSAGPTSAKGMTYHGPKGETWTTGARGRKPGWLAAEIAKGQGQADPNVNAP